MSVHRKLAQHAAGKITSTSFTPSKAAVTLAPGWSIVNGQFVGPDGQVHTDANGGVPAAASPPTAPPPPSPATPGKVDPFFRPEDLITSNNFWSQWNGTFADLDRQLGDMQRNTAFERAQLADAHKSNVSGINDNAAARGVSHSSIRDGNQATEQTQYTRQDQNLQDAVSSFATYVQGQHNNFDTVTKPGFESAMSGQAVSNAQGVNDAYVPPPAAAPTPVKPTGVTQTQQPVYTAKIVNGWLWHYYPDGHKVKVRQV